MAVRKDGDRWVVEFMFRSVRIFRRLPPNRTKGEGNALESKLRSEIFNAVDLGRLPDIPLERVVSAWAAGKPKKTLSHVKAVLGALKPVDVLSQVGEVGERLVDLWPDLAPGTVNRRLSVLKASAKYAKRKKWAPRNYSPDVELLREPSYIRREVNPEMARALIRNASTPRAKALIAGSAFTGMRLGEVLRFDPEKDIEDGAIRVRGKNGDDRLVPVPPELVPYLAHFPMDKSNWRNVYRGFERARERAGLKIRYHDLRHMAATAMAEAGHHPLVIADVLGHRSQATTRKYTHPSLEAKRRALSAIPSGFQQEPRRGAKKAA